MKPIDCLRFTRVFLPLLFLAVATIAIGATQKEVSPTETALKTPVRDFTVKDGTLGKILEHLNAVSLVPIHAELRAYPGVFSFAITNASLDEVLREVAARFEAKVMDATNCLNLVWTEKAGNQNYPMNVTLEKFQTKAATKEAAAQAVFKLPEFIEKKFYIISLQATRNSPVQKDFNLTLENVTPRDLLNEIAQRERRTYWTLFFEGNNRYFSFSTHQSGNAGKRE